MDVLPPCFLCYFARPLKKTHQVGSLYLLMIAIPGLQTTLCYQLVMSMEGAGFCCSQTGARVVDCCRHILPVVFNAIHTIREACVMNDTAFVPENNAC